MFYRLCCAATTHFPGWLVRCQRVARIGKSAYRTRGLSRDAQFFRGPHAGVACILGPHLGDDVIDLVLRLGKRLSRFPGELTGRADGRSEHRGDRPSEPRTYFGADIAATPRARPGNRAVSKSAAPAATATTVAAVLLIQPFSPSAVSRRFCSRPSCTSGLSLAGASVRPFWIGSSSPSLPGPSSESRLSAVDLAAVDQSQTGLRHHSHDCSGHGCSGEIILIDGSRQRRRLMIDGPMIEGFAIDGFRTNRFKIDGLKIELL